MKVIKLCNTPTSPSMAPVDGKAQAGVEIDTGIDVLAYKQVRVCSHKLHDAHPTQSVVPARFS